jgi:hypothetical protein
MSRLSPLLPNCQEMARLLSDSMDRALPLHVRVRMYLHLRVCSLCVGYKRQLQFICDLFRKGPVDLIDSSPTRKPGLSAEAKARIQRAIDSSH